jgi:hypothetical protein
VDGGCGNDGGGGEQRSSNDCLPTAMAEGAGELGVGDELVNSFPESGGLRHGEHARGCLFGGGKAKQQLRVAESVAAGGDGGAIADGLTQA